MITPGTAIDPQLIESRESVYLAAICGTGDTFGAAFLELSTGEFTATQVSGPNSWTKICEDIESFAPREILFPESIERLVEQTFGSGDKGLLTDLAGRPSRLGAPNSNRFSATLTPLDDVAFHPGDAGQLLKRQLNVRELAAFQLDGKTEAIRAAGACLHYARDTQRASAEHISDIKYFESNDFMVLDAVTLKNLEVLESRGESSRKTLFSVIDETITGMGGRLLRLVAAAPVDQTGRNSDAARRRDRAFRFDPARQASLSIKGSLRSRTSCRPVEFRVPRRRATCSHSTVRSRRRRISISRLSDAQSLLLQVLSENIFELPGDTRPDRDAPSPTTRRLT